VSCNPRVPRGLAEVVILPTPGPEVVAGSTRLKAGTTTKLVLNILTTATMVRLGKVYENRMIDLQPRSRKLSARAVRLVEEVAGVTRGRARRALATAAGRVRLAIVMAHTGQSARAAQATLRRHDGDLRGLLGHGVMRPRR
jgi:N-acetylmuramic acid 6-phosphate etherase